MHLLSEIAKHWGKAIKIIWNGQDRTSMFYSTHDADYVELAQLGMNHAGIVFGQQHKHTIGQWVNFLELVYTIYEVSDFVNVVEYVK
jgi:hypothetical protein